MFDGLPFIFDFYKQKLVLTTRSKGEVLQTLIMNGCNIIKCTKYKIFVVKRERKIGLLFLNVSLFWFFFLIDIFKFLPRIYYDLGTWLMDFYYCGSGLVRINYNQRLWLMKISTQTSTWSSKTRRIFYMVLIRSREKN